uniref:F-box domain-containing protein n=1 Tax=Leersia perrieri TaxID=77586 RepID=A0A0D9WV25_9ORYZ
MVDEGKEGAGSWSDLPPELLGMVFCRLLSYADRVRFRSVCRPWRLAAREQQPNPPPPLPWFALDDRTTYLSVPDGEVHRVPVPVPGDLPAGTVCRGCFDGWLLYDRGFENLTFHDWYVDNDEQDDDKLECFLMNPISKARIGLPYHWFLDLDDPVYHGQYTMYFHESVMRKIVVCSPDLVVALGDYARLHYFYYRQGIIHPTTTNWSLATVHDMPLDIVMYRGHLYSVSYRGKLSVHEFSNSGGDGSSSVAVVIDELPPEEISLPQGYRWSWWNPFYLVVSCCTGKLLMVRWRWCLPLYDPVRRWCADDLKKDVKLDVFEADMEKRCWSKVKDLGGDQALFLGTTCSKSLASPDHANFIFFMVSNIIRSCTDAIIDGVGDCIYCVYDMKNGTFRFHNQEGLSRSTNNREAQCWIRADWFFPCE